MPARSLMRLALAVAGALLLLASAPAATSAQDGGLLVVSDATYRVQPEVGRVRVTIDSVATSLEPDTPEGEVYYSGITFAVPPSATNVSASAGGIRLTARIVEETEDYRAVEVIFSRGVFYRESYAYSVSFDLLDAGGAADRDLRVGRNLVAFPVWAFGTEGEPGSTVRVELPAGFEASVQGSPMSLDGGDTPILTAEPADPFDFFAYVTADRPGAFVETPLEVHMADEVAELVVRAWDDDPTWAQRTSDLLRDGLPALEAAIGLPYAHAGSLSIEEAAISRLGTYAGMYDPSAAIIHVRYDADAFVALHEAAHLWFNDRLFRDRWIGEAWAEYYAVSVGSSIGATGFTWELDEELLAAKIPLNDWGAVGREDPAIEDYAYAATYELANLIAARTDAASLQRVWRAAASREWAYLPSDGVPEPGRRASVGQPGWQRLLDLLEERTDGTYADLWAEWVVNGQQHPDLAARADARTRYAELLEDAAGWELPSDIRGHLGDWEFAEARRAVREAEAVLRDRDRIAELAAALGLTSSDELRRAFAGPNGLEEGARLAELELTTLTELAVGIERLRRTPSLLEYIGLIGAQPGEHLDEARSAYETGILGETRRQTRAAMAARDAAEATGRSRVTLAAGTLLALDGLTLVAISGRRMRRRRPATLPLP